MTDDVVTDLNGFLSQWEALGHGNSTLSDATRRAIAEIVAMRAQLEALPDIRDEALEEAARLHENIDPACDHERLKHNIGNGYWVRNRHELLLIGTRGNIPAPAPGEQYESVIEARAGSHSRKPFHFHEIIEDMFPNLPRVELFARHQWTGWDTWGNEVCEVVE